MSNKIFSFQALETLSPSELEFHSPACPISSGLKSKGSCSATEKKGSLTILA